MEVISLKAFERRKYDIAQAKKENLSAEQYIRAIFHTGVIVTHTEEGSRGSVKPFDRKAIAKFCLDHDVETLTLFVGENQWFLGVR